MGLAELAPVIKPGCFFFSFGKIEPLVNASPDT